MAKSSKFLKNSRILTIVGFLGTLTITGCLDDITPEREVRNYGSFGTELYNIVYDNSLHSETQRSPKRLSLRLLCISHIMEHFILKWVIINQI